MLEDGHDAALRVFPKGFVEKLTEAHDIGIGAVGGLVLHFELF